LARGNQKFGTPYIFLQLLKRATSNLVHNLGLGLAYQKTFCTKFGGGLGQGSIQKKFGNAYLFLQPLKLATSNLVQSLGSGLTYQKQRSRPTLAGVWTREHQKNFGTPYVFLQPSKLATSNLVYSLGLGLAYQKKQRLGPKLAGVWARGASEKNEKKFGTCYFLQPLKLATEKLVHNMSSRLPCRIQVLRPN